MKYYSENTVRGIIKGVAHTALEQSENYADAILQNLQCIEIKEPHGRLIDADNVSSQDIEFCSTNDRHFVVIHSPTIIEASKERDNG